MTLETDWLGGALASPAPSNPGGRPSKGHGGRQRKILCDSCGFIAYTTARALERAGGLPSCACGSPMIVPNFRDRVVIDPDAARAEVHAAPPMLARQLRAELRKLGFENLIERAPARSSCSVGTVPRCRWEYGQCTKIAGFGGYCDEHR